MPGTGSPSDCPRLCFLEGNWYNADSNASITPARRCDMAASEDWTTSHDLALVYLALAYGTDHELGDNEMRALTGALRDWTVVPSEAQVQEVVMEAATVFLEGDSQAEVRRSIQELGNELSLVQRRQALQDVMRIAEADGVLLEREQGLIHHLADAWSLKDMSEDLVKDTSAVVQRRGEDWGLIHELAFIFIVVAHSANDDLTPPQIDAALDRLQEWRPDLSTEGVRDVFRRALQVYAEEPDQSLIEGSVEALKQALPQVQRLAVIDDLCAVVRADTAPADAGRELIMTLARAWDVNVRFNGQQ